MYTIRSIQLSDARQFLDLRKQIADETAFMLRESSEITLIEEQQRMQIQTMIDHHLLLIADCDGQFVGYLQGIRGLVKRNRHYLSLVVGVLQAHTRQGIGTQLFIAMEIWARKHEITRLELNVLENNTAGIALYSQRGFSVEGVKRYGQCIDNVYVSEYLMAKLLV